MSEFLIQLSLFLREHIDIALAIVEICIIFLSLSIHEWAHAFVAYALGDPTAKELKRLSINPLRHLDPFGSVFLPVATAFASLPILGYAKPVPVTPQNFNNPRTGMALVALAGPLSNILQAFILGLCYQLLYFSAVTWIFPYHFHLIAFILVCLRMGLQINLYLAFFNLLPIYPLDGSRIISVFLPQSVHISLVRHRSEFTVIFFIFLMFLFSTLGTGTLNFISGIVMVPVDFLAKLFTNGAISGI